MSVGKLKTADITVVYNTGDRIRGDGITLDVRAEAIIAVGVNLIMDILWEAI